MKGADVWAIKASLSLCIINFKQALITRYTGVIQSLLQEGTVYPMKVETVTPETMFEPIGPYSHVSKAGPFINISGTPGVDPATSQMAGTDAYSQSKQIVRNFRSMLSEVGASLEDVMHVHVFLIRVEDFQEMNRAYEEEFGSFRPARSVICVADLPKEGALMTMNLTAFATSGD